MTISSPQPLPNELWLEIFRWATLTPSALSFHSSTTYHPFQGIHFKALDIASLAVKRSLSQVCKLWNVLIEGMLYEDIIITPSWYLSSMKDHIRQMDEGLKGKIQRIYLPDYGSTTRPLRDAVADFADILRQCSPSLSAIIRPIGLPADKYSLTFHFQAEECPPLPNLQRLDWWHYKDNSEAEGLDSLMDVLRAAPNLQYLSLGGQLWLHTRQCPAAHLPRLTTLRLEGQAVSYIPYMQGWSLPSLRSVIIDMSSSFAFLVWFWERFGASVTTVELGRTMQYLPDYSAIHEILNGCSNLEELNYRPRYVHAPDPPDEPHGSLSVIRLHCHGRPIGMRVAYEETLREHLSAWCDPAYPKLRKVLLYGASGIDLDCEAITEVIDAMRRRGCVVLKVN